MLKKFLAFLMAFTLAAVSAGAQESNLSCQSALLMDFDSGEILYELNPHEKLPMASVTKIMTMLITMEEIQSGRLKYTDVVTASAYAKSMGGSTIFLDEGEQMTVDNLLKGIAVASGNDACVAIAEHISGTCDIFVSRMNERAANLGMKNTHFVNCNGLDAPDHYSTAYDIALMSRELMKHEDIYKYTTIWMDSLRDGKFTLSNTNKLVRFYNGCTGLKTGSTSKAGFCISATAKRDNLHLIAVVMNAPTSKQRQADASSMLNYGFSKYKNITQIKEGQSVSDIKVEKGTKESVGLQCTDDVKVLTDKNSEQETKLEYQLPKSVKAPVKKGDTAGKVLCKINGKVVGTSDIIYSENVEKISFVNAYGKIIDVWLGNKCNI